MTFNEYLGKGLLFFDGGFGTQMAVRGIDEPHAPEDANLNSPEGIRAIHQSYVDAGSDIITANTFGASEMKYRGKYTAEKVIEAGVRLAAEVAASAPRPIFVAGDIGPTGRLLEPMGDLTFAQAYDAFAKQAMAIEKAGANLIIIETFSDLYEAKAAILAAKENTALPVICSMTLTENGRTLTGANLTTVVAVLEGLRCDAIGLNCSLGPDLLMPFVSELLQKASVPVIILPNAGLPRQEGGKTVYDVSPERFAEYMLQAAQEGASILGGCCGTTPEYIALLKAACQDVRYTPPSQKDVTVAASGTHNVVFGCVRPVLVGERINTSASEAIQKAVASGDYDTLLDCAMEQADAGADLIDINVYLKGADEAKAMAQAVRYVQSMFHKPLVLDSMSPAVLEGAARVYNGKPVFNAVTGDEERMRPVFAAAAKYGGLVVGLCIDKGGVPATADERVAIGRRIVKLAAEYGIPQKDILLDPAVTAAAEEPGRLLECLLTIRRIGEELGVKTIAGISNVSYSLPNRGTLNAALLCMALYEGLDACIADPLSEDVMRCISACNVILNADGACADYVRKYLS